MYKCRIFTKDIKAVQDVKDYFIDNEKEFRFIADGRGDEYNLADTEYIIIPTNEFLAMAEQIYTNGKNAKVEIKPKRGKRASIGNFDDYMNKPEVDTN